MKQSEMSGVLQTKRIAVTGGTGLIGSHLVAELLKRGCRIRLLVRDMRRVGQLHKTLSRMEADSYFGRIEFYETELNNPHTLAAALTDMEVVFHCAALVTFDPERADEVVSVNTEITTHVVNACLQCGVGLMVHISSIATLGSCRLGQRAIDETCILNNPVGRSPYSVSKIYAENVVQRGMVEGLHAVIVNPSVVIGEGDLNSSSSRLVAYAMRRRLFYTNGVKGYVDVRDVARAAVGLAEMPQAVGKRFIVSAENLSFGALFSMAARVSGHWPPLIPLGRRVLTGIYKVEKLLNKWFGRRPILSEALIANACDMSYYDNSRMKNLLNFTYTPIRETLERVIRYYKRQREQ